MKWIRMKPSILLGVSVVAVVTGCGDSRTEFVVQGATEAEATTTSLGAAAPANEKQFTPSEDDYSYLTPEERDARPNISFDVSAPGINHLANRASTAAVIEVHSVSDPIWSGMSWAVNDAGEPEVIDPFYYRDVSGEVITGLWGAETGDEVNFVAWGSGVSGGPLLSFPNMTVTMDEVVPPIRVGSTVVVLLSERTFETPDGGGRRLMLDSGSYLSIWTVSGGIAESVDAGRSRSLDELVFRLLAERKAGLGAPTSLDSLEWAIESAPEPSTSEPTITSPCGIQPTC